MKGTPWFRLTLCALFLVPLLLTAAGLLSVDLPRVRH